MTMTGAQRSKAWRQRKLAAGYRLVHGRATTEPRKIGRAGEPPPHGTARRYCSADGAQVLVEVWANDSGEPVVKVALRADEWDTWGPPLPEILNEDEP
jgi:hypothetical protein